MMQYCTKMREVLYKELLELHGKLLKNENLTGLNALAMKEDNKYGDAK